MPITESDPLTGETWTYSIPGGLGTWPIRVESLAQEAARNGAVLTVEDMHRFAEEIRRQDEERDAREAAGRWPLPSRWLAKADGLLAEWAISGAHPERREQLREPIARWLEWAYEEGRAGR